MAAQRFRDGMSQQDFFNAVVAMNADLERLRTEKDQLQADLTALRHHSMALLFTTTTGVATNMQELKKPLQCFSFFRLLLLFSYRGLLFVL